MRNDWNETFRNMFRIGTPECAVFFGAAAMVLALLFLTIGFWRTLLVAALVAAGAFIGGVGNKKDWFRGVINKLFPPKQNVSYKAEAPETKDKKETEQKEQE